MADVTVEFGAQDVGLEKTLKAVQNELSSLQGKVKSGELSMSELEGAMKRIGQVESLEKRLKAMGDESGTTSPKVQQLGRDIAGAGDKSQQMGEQSGIGFGKLASAVGVGQLAAKAFTAALDAAFRAVEGTIESFKDALDLGGKLTDLSAQTGESAGNLLILQKAFDNTGIGADAVGGALAKLNKSIFGADEESQKAVAAFGRMGISLDELKGKAPTDQLALVASGLQSIPDPAIRSATAMEIFGKSGYQLLPFLTNFSGEIAQARDEVGSMADIMNRRSDVFDAVSDRFLTISQKVRDFAAGILDKALPAVDAITLAISRIDAAAIGQRLADAFLGGQQAMKGFQAAADAISVGNISQAFQVFWESLKLQAMQTADSIYKNLAAGFKTAADFFVATLGPGSGAFALLESGFQILSGKVQEGIFSGLANALEGMGPLFAKGAETAKYQMETASRSVEMLTTGLGAQVEVVRDQMAKAGAALPQSFQDNYSKIPPLFDGITAQQEKVSALEGEVAKAVAATTEERKRQTAQTEAELAARQAIRDAQASADAAEKASKTQLIDLEIKINQAKAAGNKELEDSLTQELKRLKSQEEIKKLTEEYQKTLGVNADEAARLATEFVNASNAAASISVDPTSVAKLSKEAQDAANAAGSFVTWMDYINGKDEPEGVKKLAGNARAAREEITAFGQYIGVDLDRVSYPDVAKKLGIDVMGKTGQEQLEAILSYIDDKRKDLLTNPIDEETAKTSVDGIKKKTDTLGDNKINPISDDGITSSFEKAKKEIEKLSDSKLSLTVNVDTTAAVDAINGIGGTVTLGTAADSKGADYDISKINGTVTLGTGADTQGAEKDIATIAGATVVSTSADTTGAMADIEKMAANVVVNLDATTSIEAIRASLAESLELDISAKSGTSGILQTLSDIVSDIRDFVSKLNDKLPVAALTA